MCFVVFRASGRGGLVGRIGFETLDLLEVGVVVVVVLAGPKVVVVVEGVVGFPQWRRVTGMKAEVAEA